MRNKAFREQLTKDLNIIQMKVLIVDDENEVIDMISPAFSRNGFKILSSTDLDSAMNLLKEEVPSILTLDLSMIDVNEATILKAINKLEFRKNLWIILISAASECELKHAVDIGADFYLQKPFQEKDLNKLIKKLTSGHSPV